MIKSTNTSSKFAMPKGHVDVKRCSALEDENVDSGAIRISSEIEYLCLVGFVKSLEAHLDALAVASGGVRWKC